MRADPARTLPRGRVSPEAARDAAQAHRCVGAWLILCGLLAPLEVAAAVWIL